MYTIFIALSVIGVECGVHSSAVCKDVVYVLE